MNFILAVYTLWKREIIRFVRQRNRVFGAIGQPLIFWLLFGSGFSASFRPEGLRGQMNYLEYFFPGILVMIILFTAIFSSFSIIEDRKEGFLQAALVSPAPRLSLVLGKVLGGATIALLQALLFLCLAPLISIPIGLQSALGVLGVLFLTAISLSAFGFCLAWRMDSIQGFHAIMMLVLLPMWFLSGAFFPPQGLPSLLSWLVKINPLTYALSLVRRVLYLDFTSSLGELPTTSTSLLVTVLFAGITLGIAWFLASEKRKSL